MLRRSRCSRRRSRLSSSRSPAPLSPPTSRSRVEGKTQTIFGATQPVASTPANALEALEAASVAGEFYYALTTASFGDYVGQIGQYAGAGDGGWVFKVNGVSPPVGADQVSWRTATSCSGTGRRSDRRAGRRRSSWSGCRRDCYRVSALDDAGHAQARRRGRPPRRRPAGQGPGRPRLRRPHQGSSGPCARRRPLERAAVIRRRARRASPRRARPRGLRRGGARRRARRRSG